MHRLAAFGPIECRSTGSDCLLSHRTTLPLMSVDNPGQSDTLPAVVMTRHRETDAGRFRYIPDSLVTICGSSLTASNQAKYLSLPCRVIVKPSNCRAISSNVKNGGVENPLRAPKYLTKQSPRRRAPLMGDSAKTHAAEHMQGNHLTLLVRQLPHSCVYSAILLVVCRSPRSIGLLRLWLPGVVTWIRPTPPAIDVAGPVGDTDGQVPFQRPSPHKPARLGGESDEHIMKHVLSSTRIVQ